VKIRGKNGCAALGPTAWRSGSGIFLRGVVRSGGCYTHSSSLWSWNPVHILL